MKIPKTTLKYHLDNLIKSDLITISKTKRYSRYYALENNAIKYKKYINILRLKTLREILLYAVAHMIVSRKDFIEQLELHSSTVDKALKKLINIDIIEIAPKEKGYIYRSDGGIVERSPEGREIFYRINPSVIEDIFRTFLIYYKELFDDGKICDLVENWYNLLDNTKSIPHKTLGWPKGIDKTIEKFYEIFPHPYHI
jgi:predicted transcriptional regulator